MASTLDRTRCDEPLRSDPCDAGCCDTPPCTDCRTRMAEERAARRDALLHALAHVRPRRPR